MSASSAPARISEARRRLITTACLLAQFMAAVEATIVGTAMPTIVGDLGGFHLFSWVFAAYLLAQAASTPIYGRLADFYGRKRVFFVGAALFLARLDRVRLRLGHGAAHRCSAPSRASARARCSRSPGRSSATSIRPPTGRGCRAGSPAVFGVSAIAGPVLGGFIVEHMHWSLVFWINMPVGVAAVVMLALVLDERIDAAAPTRRLRWARFCSCSASARCWWRWSQAATCGRRIAGGAGRGTRRWRRSSFCTSCASPSRSCRSACGACRSSPSAISARSPSASLMMCNGGYLPAYVQGAMGASPTVAGLVARRVVGHVDARHDRWRRG